jgi:hypothetical protein
MAPKRAIFAAGILCA